MQLARAEDGRAGDRAAHVPRVDAAVRGDRHAGDRARQRRLDPHSARMVGPKLLVLAFFNIAGWNGFVLFGVQQLPAGRSAIIAYTMPIWSTLIAMLVLHEPLNKRKIVGLVLGMLGMVVLLGDDIRHIRSTPIGAILILVRRDPVGGGHGAAAQVEAADRAEHAVGMDDADGLAAARHRRAVLRDASVVVPRPPVAAARGSRSSTTSSSPARSRTGRGSRWRARCRSRSRRCRRCRCRWSACSPA